MICCIVLGCCLWKSNKSTGHFNSMERCTIQKSLSCLGFKSWTWCAKGAVDDITATEYFEDETFEVWAFGDMDERTQNFDEKMSTAAVDQRTTYILQLIPWMHYPSLDSFSYELFRPETHACQMRMEPPAKWRSEVSQLLLAKIDAFYCSGLCCEMLLRTTKRNLNCEGKKPVMFQGLTVLRGC